MLLIKMHLHGLLKVIWILWDRAPTPFVVDAVQKSWKYHNPGWEVRVLKFVDLPQYMDTSKLKATMTIQARSDMIRLNLLNNHGGVWADATMLCMKPLDEWIWKYVKAQGFFMFGQLTCSWFVVSRANTDLISTWSRLADNYWANRDEPSGNIGSVGNYRWMDGVLIDYLARNQTFKASVVQRKSLPCVGKCSPHMFYDNGCVDEVNSDLSPMVNECISTHNFAPAYKLTKTPRCDRRAVNKNDYNTNGWQLINISLNGYLLRI